VRVASHQIEVISTHRKIGHFASINTIVPICRTVWPNLDIILIIMLYFWDKSLNCPYKIVEFSSISST
jgi:hypothetical protein